VYVRAKTDDAHAQMPVLIRIGTEQHTVVLNPRMATYTVQFTQSDVPTNEIMIEMPPADGTDAQRGNVFVQSLWAEVP
jgi:hypothetical protein